MSHLIITRKVGEAFMIGSDLIVTILAVKGGNQIRIGINAPPEVRVLREEIFRRVQREIAEEQRKKSQAAPTHTTNNSSDYIEIETKVEGVS